MRFSTVIIILAATLQSAFAVEHNNTIRKQLDEDDTECLLILDVFEYEDGTGDQNWLCEITEQQATRLGYNGTTTIDVEGLSESALKSQTITSGESIMKVKGGAYIERSALKEEAFRPKLVIPNEASVKVSPLSSDDPRHSQGRRNLAKKKGSLKTIVIRLISSDGQQAPSTSQLYDDIFSDAVNMKNRMAECSYNQLTIEYGGIVDVYVNRPALNQDQRLFEAEARRATAAKHGALEKTYDLVMYSFPDGTLRDGKKWGAHAWVNSYSSFFNYASTNSLRTLVHEIGHNMNLGHSGFGGEEYGDLSSNMGSGTWFDDGPIQCFNAANNYQLGWYSPQQTSINPLAIRGHQDFVLNGIDDYVGYSNGKYITMRIEWDKNMDGTDFFIGYNRKSGINRGTYAAGDTVVLFMKT
eukprot:jgi/Psemu1/226036/e_gw1.1712.4.1